jgi:chromosome segregation ATPase
MSDPAGIDPLAVGGGGLAGVSFAAGLIRLLFGAALKELKDQITETKAAVKESLTELKADTREQIASLKEMVERSDRRHDEAIKENTTTKNAVMALHARVDSLQMEIETLKQRRGR